MAKEVRWRLVLDTKEFTSGARVAKKEFEGFIADLGAGAGSLGKVAAAMGPVGVAAAAAMGLATAGVAAFSKVAIDAAANAVAFAGKISDLSTRTGISGEALQQLGFAGSMVGTSMESMGTAVSKMQQAMVKTPENFQQLGLSLEKIKVLAPEKQFEAVGKAIKQIQDPAQQTAATIAFFGKSGADAMAALTVDMDAAGKEAERLGIVMDDSTREALDSLGDSTTVLSTAFEHLLINFGGAIAKSPEVQNLVEGLTDAIGGLSRWIQQNQAQITSFIDALATKAQNLLGFVRTAAAYTGIDTFGTGGSRDGSGLTSSAKNNNPMPTKTWTDPAALKKRQAEIAKAEKEHLAFLEKIRHDAAMKDLKLDEAHWKKQVQMADDYGKKLLDSILKQQYAASKAKAGHNLINQLALEQQAKQLDKTAGKWRTFGDAMFLVGQAAGGPVGSAISGLGGVMDGLSAHSQQAADNLRNNGTTAMTAGQKIQAAALAVGTLTSAFKAGVQSADKWGSALDGAIAGASAGASIAGGWGALVGGVLGGAAGYLGGKKGEKQQLQALRAELERLQEEARKAGVALMLAFDPENAESLKAKIDEINRALGLQIEANNKLHEAMDRYGISISQLGPAFRQQELDKQAASLLQDWQLLNAAGVDHLVLAEKMGPAFSEYVNTAVSAGSTIPASMKPIIDDLFSQGQLLHENGEAYTQAEVDGLAYAQTMTEQFATLVQKITELVNALLGIPNVTRTVTVVTNRQNGPPLNNDGTVDGDGDPTTALAKGFEGMVTSPRKFLVGEAGPEYMSVTPAGKGGGPMNMAGVEALLRSVDARLARLPETLARTTRDAVLVGRA